MSLEFNVKNEELSVTTSGSDDFNTNPSKSIHNRNLDLLWLIINKYYLPFIIIFLDDVGQPPPAHPPVSPSHSISAPVSSNPLAKDDLIR